MSYAIVWFKRDLRWHDHAALAHAAKNGPVRCIYVIEPSFWAQADVALQHFEFIHESIQALNAHFRSLGGEIEIHVGEVPEVLSKLWQEQWVREGKQEVIEKHASRKVFSKPRTAKSKQPVQSNQMGFDF